MGCVTSGQLQENPQTKKLDRYIREDRVQNAEIKLLLLGPGESGKSTVFKQMKIIQDDGGFSQEELISYKSVIYSNCVSQMRVILEAAALLKIELHSEEALSAAQKILSLPPTGNSWNNEIGNAVKLLWKDQGIRETFSLGMKKFQLNETSNYFFDKIDVFLEENYIPSLDDILRVRVRSTGIEEATFVFDKIKFRVVDVGGQRSERRKWIHCFDCVTAIIFCASLSGYDQVLREDRTQNRLHEDILLFDEVANSSSLLRKSNDIILFLNKFDLFKEKIKVVDLNVCFQSYTGGSDLDSAQDFIKKRFLERTNSHVYVHFTVAIDTKNIQFVIQAVRETILKQALGNIGLYN